MRLNLKFGFGNPPVTVPFFEISFIFGLPITIGVNGSYTFLITNYKP
jgi:hypothetical protein